MAVRLYIPLSTDNDIMVAKNMARLHLKTIAEPE